MRFNFFYVKTFGKFGKNHHTAQLERPLNGL